MGSQFVSVHLVDPALIQARLRGDDPNLVEAIYRHDKPPNEELRPAFEVMARGTFVFLPKGQTHPDGAMYCRAVEHLLVTLGRKTWSLEFYPDESEYALWQLAFGRCDATWLDLPQSESGIAVIAWKNPDTCRSLGHTLRRDRETKSLNPRYSPEATVDEAVQALAEGASSGHGVFVIFQG